MDQKGVCRLGIVPVRSQASDKSEMVTQLLFGEHYSIVNEAEEGNWLLIKSEFDNYEGWIDKKQHNEITAEYFDHLNKIESKICIDILTTILYKKRLLQIVIGSILPISSSELFEVNEQFAFNGTAKNLGEKRGFDYIKQIAKQYMNAPYLWGGKTPFGIDCSGLTQQIFKICGYKLYRDAAQQYQQGITIENIEQATPGDLAFFESKNGGIGHVGIVMEENQILHASGHVRIDQIDVKGIYNKELSKYTHKLVGIRRILKL